MAEKSISVAGIFWILIGTASSLVTDLGQMALFVTGTFGSTPACYRPSFWFVFCLSA
ncbi:hypothetical protein [Pseudomonas putida]|uniref:hypothetical protein n=1 Tax=Pseudomonas putida TaxID=303 RepID=UPI0015E15C84|nr:hypothetical protein [Pseudomonas putida]